MVVTLHDNRTTINREQRLLDLISNRFGTDIQDLPLDEDVFERLGVNSFQVLDVLFTIETEFDVIVREEQIKELRTIRDLVSLVV